MIEFDQSIELQNEIEICDGELDANNNSLDQLVMDAKFGNPEAFEGIFNHLYPRVYAFALIRTQNIADADDVAQQTFMKVCSNLDRFEQREGVPFGAWVFRIATNTIISQTREPYRNREHQFHTFFQSAIPIWHEDSSTIYEEQLKIVKSTLPFLPPRQKEVTELRMEGMTTKQVSEKLGITENDVKVNYHKAKVNIVNKIKKMDL